MNALITADLHLDHTKHAQYRWRVFKHLRKQIEKLDIDHVFILGDLTERKDEHPADLVCRLVKEIKSLVVPVIIVMGNHDYIEPDTPFFEFLDHIPHVYFYKEPMIDSFDGVNFLFLPHADYTMDKLEELSTVEVQYAFFHGALSGAITESGHKVKGMANYFDEFYKHGEVFAGDIHVPQTMGCVEYVGAPHPIDFGDSYATRFIHLDDEGWDTIYVPSIRKERVVIRDAEELATELFEPGDIVKVEVRLERSEFATWNEIKNEIISLSKEQGFTLAGVEMKEEGGKSKNTAQRTEKILKSNPKILKRYCKSKGLDSDIIKVGLSLIDAD